MIKQLKVYEIEETFNLPKLDYDNWNNKVSVELANNGFHFLSRISFSINKLFRLVDLVENKEEIVNASKTKFANKETYEFICSIYKLYSFCDHLIEFSNIEDSEDIVVVSHRVIDNENVICLFILNKIMNVILSEKEIIEVLSKELVSFDYEGISNILLSEDKIFDAKELSLIEEEINHAIRYKFLSQKTMEIIKFLDMLNKNINSSKKNIVFMMDILKIKV